MEFKDGLEQSLWAQKSDHPYYPSLHSQECHLNHLSADATWSSSKWESHILQSPGSLLCISLKRKFLYSYKLHSERFLDKLPGNMHLSG